MTASDPIRRAWQASVTEAQLPPLEKVRAGADRLYRHVRLRNRIEYGAAVAVVLCFTLYVFMLPSPVARVGALLVVLGTLLVVWQLHRRASATPPPGAEAALPILVHQRRELARQRDALASVWLWYLAPLAPGMVMMILGSRLANPVELLNPPKAVVFALLLTFLVFGGVWELNRRAARKLQAAVDELDLLLGEER